MHRLGPVVATVGALRGIFFDVTGTAWDTYGKTYEVLCIWDHVGSSGIIWGLGPLCYSGNAVGCRQVRLRNHVFPWNGRNLAIARSTCSIFQCLAQSRPRDAESTRPRAGRLPRRCITSRRAVSGGTTNVRRVTSMSAPFTLKRIHEIAGQLVKEDSHGVPWEPNRRGQIWSMFLRT